MDVVIACPPGFEPDSEILARLRLKAKDRSQTVGSSRSRRGRRRSRCDLYGCVASMGQEEEAEEKEKQFLKYQVNSRLLSLAHPEAIVMHCLPAKRGKEITDEVMDGPQSVVFEEAENRLHAHKAIMAVTM